MKSYFQIVSKYKIQRYWKMFAEKKEQIQNLYFYNWTEKWFRNALEKKACKYVVEPVNDIRWFQCNISLKKYKDFWKKN